MGGKGKTGRMTHQNILAFPACWEQECVKALIKRLACRKAPIKIIKKIKPIVSGNNTITAAEKSISDWGGVFSRPKGSK